ncbi:iron-sulfur cluster assembly scaffold protein [Patescibacteria group bacterium]|nr:iron-sulfur cluster assembly scaffold protein [Patescibacteria group bacterium]
MTDLEQDNFQPWFYSDIVREHFFHPQNFLDHEIKIDEYNAMGRAGSPACGDELRVWLWVDGDDERIKKFYWQTFGCASAIAATSMTSVIATQENGMTLGEARCLTPRQIMESLGGLPTRKIHCSVLSDKALRDAVNDYYRRTQQFDKIEPEATRVIDPIARVTDKDIEEAVLSGAKSIDEVAQKTKVHLSDPRVGQEVAQLVRFYLEKYQ